jgi:RHS repeat-associated protein
MAPYQATSTYQVANSNINISIATNKVATLANPNDPLSLTSLVQTTTLQNDPSRVLTSNYVASSRTLTQTSPLKRTISQALNPQGQVSGVQLGNLVPVQLQYDSRGRLSQVVQGARVSSLTYDAHGNLSSSQDPLGRATSFVYDNAGRVLSETLPDGNSVLMTYDKNGNLTSITPPGRSAHSFSYNLFELLSSYLPPSLGAQLSGATNYSYNLDKQLTGFVRPDSLSASYNYDAISGLLTGIVTPSGNFAMTYDPNTNLVMTITSPDSEVMSYKYAGNILTQVNSSGPVASSVSYTYNTDGSLASLGVNSTSSAILYDKDGLVIKVGDEALTRNGVGAVSASQLGNVSESVSFNTFGEIMSDQFTLTNKNKVAFSSTFTRDSLGRIIGVQALDHDRVDCPVNHDRDHDATSYSYDNVGRLSKVMVGNRTTRTYKYDSNGNRTSAAIDGLSVQATYDAQDRLLTYGNEEFQYNANGDLVAKVIHNWLFDFFFKLKDNPQTTKYTYDVFGNLKTVIFPDARRIDYIVDGQNRRVGKKINGQLVQEFVYQSQTQIAAELDGSGKIVRQFIYGTKTNSPDYMIQNGREYRIISDQVGTPQMIVDVQSGAIKERLLFDEFGVEFIGGTSTHPFGFAGGLYDRDTGLVRFGARDYDPETGRWISKDPIRFKGGDTNLYGFVVNDPINRIDPSGTGPATATAVALVCGGAVGIGTIVDLINNASAASNLGKLLGEQETIGLQILEAQQANNQCEVDRLNAREGQLPSLIAQAKAGLKSSVFGSLKESGASALCAAAVAAALIAPGP